MYRAARLCEQISHFFNNARFNSWGGGLSGSRDSRFGLIIREYGQLASCEEWPAKVHPYLQGYTIHDSGRYGQDL